MTQRKSIPRKTKKIVRTPATRFAHLQKRMKRLPSGSLRKTQKP
jgi:hypothetical protein